MKKMRNSKKKLKKDDKYYINDIKQKLKEMGKSEFRTTNFSLIEYFAENDFNPLYEKDLIDRILSDFKSNPNRYVLSRERGFFKNEKTFLNSVKTSISKNKAFERGPDFGQISLNLESTSQYLKTMYEKYTNNCSNVNTPYKLFQQKKIPTLESIWENKEKDHHHFKDDKNMEIDEEDEEDADVKEKKIENKKRNNYSLFMNTISLNEETSKLESGIEENNKGFFIPNTNNSISNLISEDHKLRKEYPDILIKKLYTDNFGYFLKTEKIQYIIKSLSIYFDQKKSSFISKIDRRVQKIYELFKNLIENKKIYDSHYASINNHQNELLSLYKKIIKESKVINIEACTRTYNYEIYTNLREIIFIYEAQYNKIVELIKQKLYQLKNMEKELLNKRTYIYNFLRSIKEGEYVDPGFTKISNLIEDILKINNNFGQPNDSINFDEDIDNIIELFQLEKNKIVDEVKNIDKYIGNISVEE